MCPQIVCYVTRTWFTLETHQAFDQLEDGNEQALKDYLKQQKAQLDGLIGLVLGELSKGVRLVQTCPRHGIAPFAAKRTVHGCTEIALRRAGGRTSGGRLRSRSLKSFVFELEPRDTGGGGN